MLNLVQAVFSRKAPPEFEGGNGIPVGWACLSFRWVSEKQDRRRLYGQWVRIQSDYGKCYRILRFSASLKGTPASNEGEIVVDWSAWLRLSGYDDNSATQPLNLKITKAKWFEIPFVGFFHPDPSYRLSIALAYLALLLGLISFLT